MRSMIPASRSYRAHLALRLAAVGALVSIFSSFMLYHWESERDLHKSVETIRHFSRFIGNESVAINFDGENVVFVEDALRRLSAVRPILYSYVLDRKSRVVATSAGTVSAVECCFPWEPAASSRSDGDFTADFRAAADGELPNGLKILRGDRIVLVGIPIFDHSMAARIGTLVVALSGDEALSAARSDATRLAALLFALEFLVGLPATIMLSSRLARPIERMRRMLEQSASQAGANEALLARLKADAGSESIREFDLLRRRMLDLHLAIEDQQESLQRAYARASLGELASQVAHDIRSPLVSLNAAVDGLGALEGPQSTEESRRLVRGAVASIQSIAQGLLDKNRALSAGQGPVAAAGAPSDLGQASVSVCLPLALEKVLSQKRAQYRGQPGLEIAFEQGPGTYAASALVVPIELEKIVSNLVNNAVEALTGAGRVTVALATDGKTVRVEVRDTGRGIAPDLLARLGERGLTSGKAGGSGLGLSHARATILSWGGRLEVQSTVGAGTTVELELAAAEPPAWFAASLKVGKAAVLVIIDDDAAVHAAWDRRLDALRVASERRVHLTSADAAVAWFRANIGVEAVYLCDQEFGPGQSSGLEVIERLGVAATTVLVTSHFDDPDLRARCEKFGVAIVPKPLLADLPFDVQA